jgi:hypothetical protein
MTTPPSPWEPDPNRPQQPPAFSDWVRWWRELQVAGKVLLGIFAAALMVSCALFFIDHI